MRIAGIAVPASLVCRLLIGERILTVLDGFGHIKIILHTTRQMTHLTADQRILLVGDALQQIAVVGDHNQRARPSVEQVLHHGEHVGVEIVAGLVHDEHVRLVEQDEQQPMFT